MAGYVRRRPARIVASQVRRMLGEDVMSTAVPSHGQQHRGHAGRKDSQRQPGAMEQYRHQAKRDVRVSEYYATLGEMRRTLSEYLRTSGPRLDIMKYIGRQSLVLKDF